MVSKSLKDWVFELQFKEGKKRKALTKKDALPMCGQTINGICQKKKKNSFKRYSSK